MEHSLGYKLHLFVCTAKKEGKPCCGEKGSEELRQHLKKYCDEKYGKKIRVNISGCLDYCSQGIAAVSYPQNKWFTQLTKESFPDIIKYIDDQMKNS